MADIRVMIIDDSALVRGILTQGLNAAPGVTVVGTAHDAFDARAKILALEPDVLTLDVEMPRMNGVEFLRRLMPRHPIPVIMVSALTERGCRVTLDALEAGAVDFVAKPRSSDPQSLQTMLRELHAKIRVAARARVRRPAVRTSSTVRRPAPALPTCRDPGRRTIVIGASTGGTEAIREVVGQLPAACAPVVIVQHMPAGFTGLFADRLNDMTAPSVREAVDGDPVRPGEVLIAPGGLQMRLVRTGTGLQVHIRPGDKVNGHCPSVDVLMESAARACGADAVGVMLTGMGRDGAAGLKAMREAGARTLAQDEATCVVYGMPKAAWELGAAEKQVPLQDMAARILGLLNRSEELV